MNQEKFIQVSPPPLFALFCALPSNKNTPKNIDKTTIEEFLNLSRLYLELDKNS